MDQTSEALESTIYVTYELIYKTRKNCTIMSVYGSCIYKVIKLLVMLTLQLLRISWFHRYFIIAYNSDRVRNTGRGLVFAGARLPRFTPPRPHPRALSRAHGPSSSCEEDTRAPRREGAGARTDPHPSRAEGARSGTCSPCRKSSRAGPCRGEGSRAGTCSRGEGMVVDGSAQLFGLLLFRL
nr:uncharacterized protein LOC116425109 [Nomia melanderi]